jgi:hypothetical protein
VNSASDASKGSATEKGRTLRPRVAKNSSTSEVKKRFVIFFLAFLSKKCSLLTSILDNRKSE